MKLKSYFNHVNGFTLDLGGIFTSFYVADEGLVVRFTKESALGGQLGHSGKVSLKGLAFSKDIVSCGGFVEDVFENEAAVEDGESAALKGH